MTPGTLPRRVAGEVVSAARRSWLPRPRTQRLHPVRALEPPPRRSVGDAPRHKLHARRRSVATSRRKAVELGANAPGAAHQGHGARNGVSLGHASEDFYALTMGVAEGRIGKPAVAAELERIAKAKLASE